MEVLLVLLVGIVGGTAAGLIMMAVGWHRRDAIAAMASRRRPLDAPAINYSSLKVSGVGGFGLVVLCVAISIALPTIRNTMLTGLGLGIVLAFALVLWRRNAPLPSSGAKPGANTTLAIDDEEKESREAVEVRTGHRLERRAV